MPKKSVSSTPKKPKPKSQKTTEIRRLPVPAKVCYKPKTWRYKKPIPLREPLPKARLIVWSSLRNMGKHSHLLGGILVTYAALNLLLVRGLSGSGNLITLKTALNSLAHGTAGKLENAGTSFLYLLGTSGSGNATSSGTYQTMALVVCSLAFIWALRQTYNRNNARIRDSFYKGMYPLIPFLTILLIIGIQLLPLAIGGGLYSTVIANGIAVQLWERLVWGGLFVVLGLWSLRMVTGSLFALYIVTLPDMTPLKALRSARELVYGRRLLIWRKLIFLPVIMLLIAAIVELPLILFITPLAAWVFFVLSVLGIGAIHSYVYGLYRELL